MKNLVAELYKSPKTVFTNKDLAFLWQETSRDNLKSKIAYYVKHGALIHLTRGIFAKDKNYNPKELSTSIYTPSYISFETVLREAGIIFQHYDTIFVAGPWPKTVKIDAVSITFRKLKDTILFNPAGVDTTDIYSIASPERAFLDTLYLFPFYHFDNLRRIKWEKCAELITLYKNKQMTKRFITYQKQYAE